MGPILQGDEMEPVYKVALVVAAVVMLAALFYFVCRKIFLIKFLRRRNWCVPYEV